MGHQQAHETEQAAHAHRAGRQEGGAQQGQEAAQAHPQAQGGGHLVPQQEDVEPPGEEHGPGHPGQQEGEHPWKEGTTTPPKPPMEKLERSMTASGRKVTSASLPAERRLVTATPASTMVIREAPALRARP